VHLSPPDCAWLRTGFVTVVEAPLQLAEYQDAAHDAWRRTVHSIERRPIENAIFHYAIRVI